MEDNKDIESIDDTKEVEVMTPFFGLFFLTRTQRILHAFVISMIGSAFFAYNIWDRLTIDQRTKDIIEGLNGWYFLPCYILSMLLFISAFPIDRRTSGTRIMIQHILRMILSVLWLVLYIQQSNILLLVFYKFLPA